MKKKDKNKYLLPLTVGIGSVGLAGGGMLAFRNKKIRKAISKYLFGSSEYKPINRIVSNVTKGEFTHVGDFIDAFSLINKKRNLLTSIKERIGGVPEILRFMTTPIFKDYEGIKKYKVERVTKAVRDIYNKAKNREYLTDYEVGKLKALSGYVNTTPKATRHLGAILWGSIPLTGAQYYLYHKYLFKPRKKKQRRY